MNFRVKVVNVSRRATVPSSAAAWEQAVLAEQDSIRRDRPIGRRRTVAGIPEWHEFVNDWHDRYDGHHDPIEEDEGSRSGTPTTRPFSRAESTVSQDGMFDMSSLGDKIQHKASLPRTPKSTPRRKLATPRSKLQSPKITASRLRSPDPSRSCQSPKRGRDSVEPEAFDFETQVHCDKANFYTSQQQQQSQQEEAKRSRRKTYHEDAYPDFFRRSQMPSPEHFRKADPSPKPRKPTPAANADPASLYRAWHDECNAAFRTKATMTSIPVPPIPACGACTTTAVCNGNPEPSICMHGLGTLFRSAITAPSKSGAGTGSSDYFTLLKEERNRFHTDKFSTCSAAVKANIEREAQDLFIMIQELLKAEQKRMIAEEAMKIRAREGPAASAASSYRWDDDGRQAW